MRELHIVGTADDGALLLAATPDAPAEFRLQGARGVPATPEQVVRREPSPAQIQARLRGGADPATIARETGTTIERVERWAAPVQAEMDDVLRGAMDTRVTEGDRRSSGSLRELVAAAAADTGVEVEWHTTRRADGRWRVLLRMHQGGRTRTASWVWDGRARTLEAASGRARRLSFGD